MDYNHNNNPNGERYANARFLVGMGPMPPPTNRELAVAHMQHSLNHGVFNGQDRNSYYPVLPHGGHQYDNYRLPQYNMQYNSRPPAAPDATSPAQGAISTSTRHNTPANYEGERGSLRQSLAH